MTEVTKVTEATEETVSHRETKKRRELIQTITDVAALGFRVKSGWATAVLLGGSAEVPHVLDRRRVELSDPADSVLRQPYHEAMGVGLTDSATLTRRISAIERYSRHALSRVFSAYRGLARDLCGAGLVVGSDADPERIANQHIRAHASEGRLFRRVVQEAAEQEGLRCLIWVERSVHQAASQAVGLTERQLKELLTRLGKPISGGWRSDDKLAALAAWLVLKGQN
jgi:hypothetical protein